MDLLLLGAARRTLPLRGHFPSSALAGPSRQPVAVVFDGSETAQRALKVALRIARAGGQTLSVFLVAANADEFTALRQQVAQLAGPVVPQFQELVAPDMERILAAVRSERASTVILGMNEQMIAPASFDLLRKRLSCPAILVK